VQLGDRRGRLALAIAAVALPVIVAAVEAVRRPWFATSDYALIALQTMDVPGNMPLYGVYSRYGFHHPGPILFVIYALPMWLLGPNGMLVAATLVNLVAVVAAVVVLDRRGGRPLLVLGTLGLVVLELSAADRLADPWNPWVPMLPFALALLLAWSVWERDWWALPVLIFVLSFVVQAHLGYLLLAAWLGGLALVVVGMSWRRRRETPPCPPRVLAVSAAVGLLAWTLPLWDLVVGNPGNLRLIASHVLHSAEPRVGAATAAHLIGRELGGLPPALGGAEPLQPFVGALVGRSLLAVVPFVLVLGSAVVVAVRRRDHPPLRLLALIVGGVAVGWLSIARYEGPAYPYLVRWLWPLVVVGLIAAGWSFQRAWVARSAPKRSSDVARPTVGRYALLAGVMVIAVVSVAAAVSAGQAPLPNASFSAEMSAVAGPVAAAVRERGTVVMDQWGGWGEEQTGIVAELERRGVRVFVPDSEAFAYGASRTIGGRTVDGVLVVAVEEGRRARRAGAGPPDGILVASYDPLDAGERLDADALAERSARALLAEAGGPPMSDPLSSEEKARLRSYTELGRPVDVYLDPAP
jgi:hypothetical protein